MGSRKRGTQHRREAQGFRKMVLKRSPRTTGGQLAWETDRSEGLNGRLLEGKNRYDGLANWADHINNGFNRAFVVPLNSSGTVHNR